MLQTEEIIEYIKATLGEDAIIPPSRPNPTACCGRGCVPCIYDYYTDNVRLWKDHTDRKILDLECKKTASLALKLVNQYVRQELEKDHFNDRFS